MKLSNILMNIVSLLLLPLSGCGDDNTQNANGEDASETEKVGFEIIEIVSPNEILVWKNDEPLTKEDFDAIQISGSWRKNEPREGDADGGVFLRSPDAQQDGEFTVEEHFGYRWLYNAKVVQQNVPLPDNPDGLLTGRYIAKYHQVEFKAGRALFVLISPDGTEYVRISRDANRTTDTPVIPSEWTLEERVIIDNITIDLPNPTLNIRAENNQDSFQGPVVF